VEQLAYGAFAVVLIIIVYAFLKSRKKLFVDKRYEDGVVSIEVRSGGEELMGVLVIDAVPLDGRLDLPEGARESESVEGRSVRWSIPVLQAGRRVVLKYGLKTAEKVLPPVDVRASQAQEIRARSDEIHI